MQGPRSGLDTSASLQPSWPRPPYLAWLPLLTAEKARGLNIFLLKAAAANMVLVLSCLLEIVIHNMSFRYTLIVSYCILLFLVWENDTVLIAV